MESARLKAVMDSCQELGRLEFIPTPVPLGFVLTAARGLTDQDRHNLQECWRECWRGTAYAGMKLIVLGPGDRLEAIRPAVDS